jgi:hypothetical protein
VLVILPTLAVFVPLVQNWNSWEGAKVKHVTVMLMSAEIPELANNLRPGLYVTATVRNR